MVNNQKHEFAFYSDNADQLTKEFVIDDPLLLHRMKDIVRLNTDDVVIVFNQQYHVRVRVKLLQKKAIMFDTLQRKENNILQLPITFLLPLLKKEALMDAAYNLTELGANNIQLVLTKKVQRPWIEKEMDKLKKVIIAAAEQSKNFAFPSIQAPHKLLECLQLLPLQSERIFFDMQGIHASQWCNALLQKKIEQMYLMIGPEGDLTEEEKEILKKHNFNFYKLTETVLRSQQAATVGLGIVRSLMRE